MSTLPPENPERRPDHGSEPEPELPADLVVPDDISMLSDEVSALRREWAAERRTNRRGRWQSRGRFRTSRRSAPFVVVAFLLVAAFGILLSYYGPKARQSTTPSNPLASPTAARGTIGGLLPHDTLQIYGGSAEGLATIRPVVFALVPVGCNCAAASNTLVTQAADIDIGAQIVFVGTPGSAAAAESASQFDENSVAYAATDPHGVLESTYHAGTKLTLVLVSSDGVVTNVVHGFTGADRLSTGYNVSGPAAS